LNGSSKIEVNNKIMKKNYIKFFSLFVLLFVVRPGLIFAEELIQTETTQTEQFVLDVNEATSTDEQEVQGIIEPLATTTELMTMESEQIATTTENNPVIFSAMESTSTSTITINLNVRYRDYIVFSGPVTLTKEATTTLLDNLNIDREIITSTALGALNQADLENVDFKISDLAYYASWNSFLINCLDVATSTNSSLEKACYNWQYVVNDTYPSVGADQYHLSDGDNIYFYFGEPRILELSTTTMSVGETLTVTAKNYDYQNNLYVPLSGYVVGVTQTDPNNPWTPIVLFSTTSNMFGQATFIVNASGTYILGFEADYYYHYPDYRLNVLDSGTSSTTPTQDSQTGGSAGNNLFIDIKKAIQFIVSKRLPNGSFGGELYTDWAALGLAASDDSEAKSLIKKYLISHNFSDKTLLGYERHVMALMSLGINPYTGTDLNYIAKILEKFDGSQFGDEDLVNDDIFALFPLLNAGYHSDDKEIYETVDFIISKQISSGDSMGSWDNSVDVTAAAIQALALVQDLPKVNSTLEKAKGYLKKHQKSDAGFDAGASSNSNVSSTAWVWQAVIALGEGQADWTKNGKTIEEYLASKQNIDGELNDGDLDEDSRLWATSYLIRAYKEKTWDALMSNFKKPKIEISSKSFSNNSNDVNEILDEGESTSNSENVVSSESLDSGSDDQTPLSNFSELVGKEKSNDFQNSKIIEKTTKNLLPANAIGAVDDSGLLKTLNSFIDTTLVGLSTMLGFIVSLFNF